MHIKWIAFGYLAQSINGSQFCVLDVMVYEKKCTAQNLRETIQKIQKQCPRRKKRFLSCKSVLHSENQKQRQ